MTIDLYYVPGSAPCRNVILTARALKLDLNLKLMTDHKHSLKPDFQKLNPQKTLPTMVDGDFSLCESRAIMIYLVNKYGKDSKLYPEDIEARAIVDQLLYFDASALYQRFGDFMYPQVFFGAPADKDKLAKVDDALKVVEKFLDGQEYAAGPNVTLADLSLITTVSIFEVSPDIDFKKYHNIKRWYEKVKNARPGFKEIIEEGVQAFQDIINSLPKSTPNIDLYYIPSSAPCRAVLLTGKALNLNLNLKVVDRSDRLNPEYLKMNPQHTVPTLVDDGFSVWESRAIMTYLVNKYGKGSTLYPEDPKARAVVEQRLYFDMGTLYQKFAEYFYPQFSGTPGDEAQLAKIEEALQHLDTFLDGQEYCAGPNMTLADLSIVASVSSFEVCPEINIDKFANVKRWYEKMKSTAPGYQEVNQKGVEKFKTLVKDRLQK